MISAPAHVVRGHQPLVSPNTRTRSNKERSHLTSNCTQPPRGSISTHLVLPLTLVTLSPLDVSSTAPRFHVYEHCHDHCCLDTTHCIPCCCSLFLSSLQIDGLDIYLLDMAFVFLPQSHHDLPLGSLGSLGSAGNRRYWRWVCLSEALESLVPLCSAQVAR